MQPIQNGKINDLVLQGQIGGTGAAQTTDPAGAAGTTFADMLQGQLKVSGHARTRLESRNIQLDQNDWNRVLGGVQKAAAKGSKESLVMIDNVALVVSVKNKTVITAVDQDNLKDNIFTNIDSAVIV
jgi:flagellar operon protein